MKMFHTRRYTIDGRKIRNYGTSSKKGSIRTKLKLLIYGAVEVREKDIKEINKRLKVLNYVEEKLDDKVEVNIDFAKRHLVDTIYKQAILEGITTTFVDICYVGVNAGRVSWIHNKESVKWNGEGYWWNLDNYNEDVILNMVNNSIFN